MPVSPRQQVLGQAAEMILEIKEPHPIRVAVDGVDAAGKSFFADELGHVLVNRKASVIRSSIDYFHFPRQRRHARYGSESPLGYYEDSFDYAKVRQCLLDPLGPGGNRAYRQRAFDFQTDTEIQSPWMTAPLDAILVFDGIFLLRPELADCWDLSIFLDIPFELSAQRASERLRDRSLFGDTEQVRERYRKRYIPGQQIYFDRCQPQQRADVIIDNQDLERPRILGGRWFEAKDSPR